MSKQVRDKFIPNALTIAGSDPSGGAGIQADLKSFSANRVYGMSVLTALTAQNTLGVSGIHKVPKKFIENQLNTIFHDIKVDAIKIGMIANSDIAKVIFKNVKNRDVNHIVIDPVMVAKGGAKLLEDDAIDVLRDKLFNIADVITPNLPEAALLTGRRCAKSKSEMLYQAKYMLDMGPRAIFLKGGHLEGSTSPDLLLTGEIEKWFESDRIDTTNTHGTGCTLSSAICANLARGLEIEKAAEDAKLFVTNSIKHSNKLQVGHGHGPTHHFHGLW